MVATRESATLAKRLITNACAKQRIQPGQLTLHQDRGAPMKAKSFSQMLIDLDILASYSRPLVSDDNPFSESQFKTLKYAPSYPGRFTGPQEARTYFEGFFPWYNTQHRHSGLGLLTPDSVASVVSFSLTCSAVAYLRVPYFPFSLLVYLHGQFLALLLPSVGGASPKSQICYY